MKNLKYLIGSVIIFAGLIASAQSSDEQIAKYFWQSPEVIQRMNDLAAQGYTEKRGETFIIPKHTSVGPYGSSERSVLVSQVFVWKSVYPRTTSLVGVVALNAYGKPYVVKVLSLPKGGPNDLGEAQDEN